MSCSKRMEGLLPLLAGGELSGRERRAVTDHLAGCASCAARLAELEALRAILAAPPEPDFTEGERAAIRRNVLRTIREEDAGRAAAWPGFRRLLAVLVPAGAVALVVVALLPSIRRDGTGPSPRPVAGLRPTPSEPLQSPAPETPRPAPPALAPERIRSSAPPRTVLASRRRAVSRTEPVPFGPAPTVGGPSRIEIQTRNPNVRIIWLAPSEPEPGPNQQSS